MADSNSPSGTTECTSGWVRARTVRQDPYQVRIDTAFEQVVAACAAARPDRPDTWINRPIERLYKELFMRGHGHSVECWKDGALVGGLYGVSHGAAFFGESMFSRETDASKVALVPPKLNVV